VRAGRAAQGAGPQSAIRLDRCRWNFNKVLISRSGDVVATFDQRARPMGRKITRAVESVLK